MALSWSQSGSHSPQGFYNLVLNTLTSLGTWHMGTLIHFSTHWTLLLDTFLRSDPLSPSLLNKAIQHGASAVPPLSRDQKGPTSALMVLVLHQLYMVLGYHIAPLGQVAPWWWFIHRLSLEISRVPDTSLLDSSLSSGLCDLGFPPWSIYSSQR